MGNCAEPRWFCTRAASEQQGPATVVFCLGDGADLTLENNRFLKENIISPEFEGFFL